MVLIGNFECVFQFTTHIVYRIKKINNASWKCFWIYITVPETNVKYVPRKCVLHTILCFF